MMDEEAFSAFEGALDALEDIQRDFGQLENMDIWPEEWEEIQEIQRFMADLVERMEDFYMDHARRSSS